MGADNSAQVKIPWKADMLIGHRFTLADSRTCLELSFYSNGNCAATIGDWNGLICGPMLTWNIDKDGMLDVGDTETHYHMVLQGIGGKFFRVLLNGKDQVMIQSFDPPSTFARTSTSAVSTCSGPLSPWLRVTLRIVISVILGLWVVSLFVALNIIIYYAAYRCIADIKKRRKTDSAAERS
jgi:hypothetical protein